MSQSKSLETLHISALQFGTLSSDEILAQSVAEITSAKYNAEDPEGTVYDPRMGTIDPQTSCPTCSRDHKTCPGHFGHMVLPVPVVHPLHHKFVLNLLRCFCHKCAKLLVSEGILELRGLVKHDGIHRFSKLTKIVEKTETCFHCLARQPRITFAPPETTYYLAWRNRKEDKIVLSPQEIFKILDNVTDDEVRLLGFKPAHMHPRDLIICVLPVIPPVDRPFVSAEGVTCDDDLTIQYQEVAKTIANLLDKKIPPNKYAKCLASLIFRIRCLFDNSNNKAKHTNGRPFKGYKRRISGKEGQVRCNLMGKRVEQAARSVIGPDPTLRLGDIAVPPKITDTLTCTVEVNRFNQDYLQDIVDSDKANHVVRGKSRRNLRYATSTKSTQVRKGDVVPPNNRRGRRSNRHPRRKLRPSSGRPAPTRRRRNTSYHWYTQAI